MNPEVALYLPLFDGATWCRDVVLPTDVAVIASDNGSTDNSAEILEQRGATVLRQAPPLGRLGNWEFCLNHFRQSSAEWMKFLFVGDRVSVDIATQIRRAAAAHPQARVLLFHYSYETADHAELRRPSEVEAELTPSECLTRFAGGNWCGGFISMAINRRALEGQVSLLPFAWAADFGFAVELLGRTGAAVIPQNVATFVAPERRHHGELWPRLQSALEEAWVRDYALRLLDADSGERGAAARRAIVADLIRHSIYVNAELHDGGAGGIFHQNAALVSSTLPTSVLVRELFGRLTGRREVAAAGASGS